MKKLFSVCMSLLMILTGTVRIQSQETGTDSVDALPPEFKDASTFQYYNITLTNGYHSADSADVEGPMFVTKDSNLGKEYITFSYGAIFNAVHNGVGEELDDDQLIALSIGGKVNNYTDKGIYPSLGDAAAGSGWLATPDDNGGWIEQAFTQPGVSAAQKKIVGADVFDEMKAGVDRSVKVVNDVLYGLVSSYHPYIVNNKQVKTMGEWIDGRFVSYDIYQSDIDPTILIVNIEPDASGEVSVDIMGFDYETIIQNQDIDQIFVTSFSRDHDGDVHHAKKVIFKGNFLANHKGQVGALDLSDPEAAEHANKVSYFFPSATQATNFYNRLSWNSFKAPDGIAPNDLGVKSDGSLAFYKDYLKNYATGSSNNGSAENGGGPAVIGSVIAPKAAVVLSGGNINGFLVSNDLHQRNGAEVHNFRNRWYDRSPKKGSLKVTKHDGSNPSTGTLAGAKFILFKESDETWLFLNETNGEKTWSDHYDDATQFETDGQGELNIQDLDAGRYYLREVVPPAGFEPNEQFYIVDIEVSEVANHVVEMTVENYPEAPEPKKGSLSIRKVDDSSNPLEGAEFILYRFDEAQTKLYYTGQTEVGTWTDDVTRAKHLVSSNTGLVTVNDLELGDYYIYEVKPPTGFIPNPTEYKITVTTEGNTTNIDQEIVNVEDTPWEPHDPQGSITLEKYNEDYFSETLAGAKFSVSHTFKGETRYLSNVFDDHNEWSTDINQAYLLTTQTDGRITLGNLKFGTYVFKEEVAPDGFELLEDIIEIELQPKNQEVSVELLSKIPNRRLLGSIALHKEDHKTGNPLRGAEYLLYRNHGIKEYYTGENIWTTDIENALRLQTKNDGIISVTNIPYDTYYFQEVKAPAGHILDDTPIEVILNDTAVVSVTHKNELIPEALGSLSLTKFDEGESNVLKGAEFVLFRNKNFPEYYGKMGVWTKYIDEAKIYTTDDSGLIHQDALPYGIYYFEEITAPEGHILNQVPIKITLDGTNNPAHASVDFINIKEPDTLGSVSITKNDADNPHVFLQGSEFVFYYNALIPRYYVSDGVWSTDINEAKIFTTDHRGEIIINNLAMGTYYFKETKAPDGFVLDETPVIVELTDTHNPAHVSVTKENEAVVDVRGSLELLKIDDIDGSVLENAGFILYRHELKPEYYHKDGSGTVTWTSNKTDATVLKTGGDGKITVSDLEFGTYYFEETKAPEGYIPNAHPFKLILDDLHDPAIASISIENSKEKGMIRLVKVDGTHPEITLKGAAFVLYKDSENPKYYQENGTSEPNWVTEHDQATQLITDESGLISVDNLPFGTYFMKEVKAPDGFDLDDTPLEIILTNHETPAQVTVTKENYKKTGALELKKHDDSTQETALKGAKFVLFRNESRPEYLIKAADGVISWDEDKQSATFFETDARGLITIEGMDLGTYYFQEVQAPEGYILDDTPVVIVLDETNSPAKAQVKRKNIKETEELGMIELVKTDDMGSVLSDASFVLFRNDVSPEYYVYQNDGTVTWTSQKEAATRLKTDNLGTIKVQGLVSGTYYFQEVISPQGYLLDETPIPVILVTDVGSAQVSKVNLKAPDLLGSLTLLKVDHDDKSKGLVGAGFIISKDNMYYVSQNEWTDKVDEATTLYTNQEGKLFVNNLPFGTYTLTEKIAPEGYTLNDEPMTFIINNENVMLERIFENTKTPETPDLPSAGVSTNKNVMYGSIGLIVAGGILILLKRNRK
ncbi:SpaA isopeptide-forming pilin-related protein [Erysipelothrix rhusiopathiae]|uniref:SpaA isopeptide-forming pilin-related protein n=1 Tax=Erysipelothrix rhusiopathiae TaxID=1648 RepID=UPI002B252F20|nr:SpaA isopeptide-forming pilin-related protein [Erysipelothrix rhusiopathiae]WRB92528.1 SpaA isopeptide-forming pilin-related protein [Erysipelothrix rhusiopathiae]